MRHQVSGRKLGRTTSHRTAMLRNMAASLFQHERITTTVQKAKELRPFAEKLITLAKKETLHARRQVLRHIKDREVVKKLFETIGIRYATRPGGYTRIIRTEFRRGDNAEMAIIELVDTKMSATKPKKKAAPAAKKTQKVQKPAEAEHKEAAPEEAEAVEVVEEPGVESEPAEAEAEPAEAKADTAEESSSEEKPEEKSGEEDNKE